MADGGSWHWELSLATLKMWHVMTPMLSFVEM